MQAARSTSTWPSPISPAKSASRVLATPCQEARVHGAAGVLGPDREWPSTTEKLIDDHAPTRPCLEGVPREDRVPVALPYTALSS